MKRHPVSPTGTGHQLGLLLLTRHFRFQLLGEREPLLLGGSQTLLQLGVLGDGVG